MHQEVMKVTRVVMGAAWYVVINCDEMSTVDN